MSRAFVKDSDDDLGGGRTARAPASRARELRDAARARAAPGAPAGAAGAARAARAAGRRGFRGEAEAARRGARPAILQRAARARRWWWICTASRATRCISAPRCSIRDEEGKPHRFTIVGDDEADVARRQDQLGLAPRQGDDRRARGRHGRLAPSGGRDRGRDRRDRLSGAGDLRPVSSDRKTEIRSRAGQPSLISSALTGHRSRVTSRMKFLSLLVALLLEQVRPLRKRNRLYQWFGRYAAGLEEKFNGGQYRHGVIAWLLAAGPLLARHAGGLSTRSTPSPRRSRGRGASRCSTSPWASASSATTSPRC